MIQATPLHRNPIPAIVLTFLALLMVSFPNLADPFLRHDDYPALLAAPQAFYEKTLHEGRWVNYWWHLRSLLTPAWLNFTVYQMFWAIFCTATAVITCGPKAQRMHVALLAVLIALAVPSTLISLWFNTLLPGVAIITTYALLAVWLPQRSMRLLLFVFVPISLMAYTTFPIMILTICLVAHGQERSWRDLFTLMGIFLASFALGMLTIYTMNYVEHGVFGIPMADWRDPNPARDLASLMVNIETAASALWTSLDMWAFESRPLLMVLAAIALMSTAMLIRYDRWLLIYITAGLSVGLGLLILQVILSGIGLPARTTGFAWMLLMIAAVRAMALALEHKERAGKLMMLALLAITASYVMKTSTQYASYVAWQQDTRAFAAALGGSDKHVYVTGDYNTLASAQEAFVQEPRALRMRMHYLTGRWFTDCLETPADCPEITPHQGSYPHVTRGAEYDVIHLAPGAN